MDSVAIELSGLIIHPCFVFWRSCASFYYRHLASKGYRHSFIYTEVRSDKLCLSSFCFILSVLLDLNVSLSVRSSVVE
jgi:hypothetical protein